MNNCYIYFLTVCAYDVEQHRKDRRPVGPIVTPSSVFILLTGTLKMVLKHLCRLFIKRLPVPLRWVSYPLPLVWYSHNHTQIVELEHGI